MSESGNLGKWTDPEYEGYHTCTVKLTDRQFTAAKKRMAVEGVSWQKVLSAAINAYIIGDLRVTPEGRYTVLEPRIRTPRIMDEDSGEAVDIRELKRDKSGRVHSKQGTRQRMRGRRQEGWGVGELVIWLRLQTGRKVQAQKLRKMLKAMEVPKAENGRWMFEGEDDPVVIDVLKRVVKGELDNYGLEGL